MCFRINYVFNVKLCDHIKSSSLLRASPSGHQMGSERWEWAHYQFATTCLTSDTNTGSKSDLKGVKYTEQVMIKIQYKRIWTTNLLYKKITIQIRDKKLAERQETK